MPNSVKPNKIPEYMIIENPYSGKMVNVLPLFELMSEDALNDGPQSIIEKIQEVHDFLSTSVPKIRGCQVAVDEWAQANYWLVKMRKTLENMNEFSIR
ncbi:hypothetical protein IC229_05925 [Spirosoma sp. BT702]|uniref:Uncharacterized protein n=1 Tax=Spirosoma profusum TaxID=2771354 RepID=A0A926XUD3_9BACT|nr:hypothetical protein [Spirosoma profusum]MBD2700164.1 hypothetical protein [Spirosoma profusum]